MYRRCTPLALLRRRPAGVPHEVVGDEHPAPLNRIQKCHRPTFGNERRGTIHFHHGETSAGGRNGVTLCEFSLEPAMRPARPGKCPDQSTRVEEPARLTRLNQRGHIPQSEPRHIFCCKRCGEFLPHFVAVTFDALAGDSQADAANRGLRLNT
jgi:hypothetical protein